MGRQRAVLLADAGAVLALRPGFVGLDLGVVGLHPNGSPQAVEVLAFFPNDRSTVEDPVTRSLIAALGPWLLRTGRVTIRTSSARGPPSVVRAGSASRAIRTARSGSAAPP